MRGLVLLIALGCGSPPAPVAAPRARTLVIDGAPATPATRAPRGSSAPRVPRPDLAIELGIDLMLEATAPGRRWPLPRAPSLEPHHAIVRAFHGAIDPWTTLCHARKRVRTTTSTTEVLDYLAAWCKLGVRDVDAGLRGLASVAAGSTVGRAARLDIIDALSDRDDAITALHWLRDHKLDSTEMLEYLAATYTELDRVDDARRVNELIVDRDPDAPAAVQCRRLRREMRTAEVADRLPLRGRIDRLARTGEGICVQLTAQLDCPLLETTAPADPEAAAARCNAALISSSIAPETIQLAAAWKGWPTGRATFDMWWSIAWQANRTRPHAGADTLTVAALENALFESGCDPMLLGNIRLLAIAIRSTTDHPLALDPALDRLADVGATECRRAARL